MTQDIKDFEDFEDGEIGVICPFCGKRNTVYNRKLCSHYGGSFNGGKNYWEFEDGIKIMKRLGGKITTEFKAFEKYLEESEETLSVNSSPVRLKKEQKKIQKIVDDNGLGMYQSKRLKEIITKAEYKEDEEMCYMCKKGSFPIRMIFIDKAGQDQANKYLKSK